MRRLTAVIAAFVLVAAVPAGAAGPGGFGEPQLLQRVPTSRLAVIDAATARGIPSVLYAVRDAAYVLEDRRGARPQRLGPSTMMPRRRFGGHRPPGELAAGTDGTRVAVWFDGARLRAAVARPGRPFSGSRVIGRGPRWAFVHAAVAGDGTAVVVWQPGRAAWAAIKRPGERWSPTTRLASVAALHALGADAHGGAIVGWSEARAAQSSVDRFAVLAPGAHRFGPAQPEPAGDGSGAALRVVLRDGSSVFSTDAGIRRRSAAGTFGPAQAGVPDDIALAASPDGAVLAHGTSRTTNEYAFADAPAGGPFAPAPSVDPGPGPPWGPADTELYRWSGGAGAAIYSGIREDYYVHVRTRGSAQAPFGPPVTVLSHVDAVSAPGRAGALRLFVVRPQPMTVPGQRERELSRLYVLRRPAGRDRRAPRLLAAAVGRLRSSRADGVGARFTLEEAATVSMRAVVRARGRRWTVPVPAEHSPRSALSTVATHIPVPRRAGCRAHVTLIVRLRDSAGKRSRTAVAARTRCRRS